MVKINVKSQSTEYLEMNGVVANCYTSKCC
jgi:hypothetical protein